MSLIAGLLSEFLREIGGIQAFLIRHISRTKISNYTLTKTELLAYYLIQIATKRAIAILHLSLVTQQIG